MAFIKFDVAFFDFHHVSQICVAGVREAGYECPLGHGEWSKCRSECQALRSIQSHQLWILLFRAFYSIWLYIYNICISIHHAQTGLLTEVFRQRVFIVATKPGFNFKDQLLLAFGMFWQVKATTIQGSQSSKHSVALQDARLKTATEFEEQCHRPWNSSQKPLLQDWLVSSFSKDDAKRLHAVGNVVFPKAAELAINLVESKLRQM